MFEHDDDGPLDASRLFDEEGDDIPRLIPPSDDDDHEKPFVHQDEPGHEPGLPSLDIQSAGWPKKIGIRSPASIKECYQNMCLYRGHRGHSGRIRFTHLILCRMQEQWLRSLLLVNRNISADLQQMLWEPIVKRFNQIGTLDYTIPMLRELPFNALNRVSLSLNNCQLFHLIGFTCRGEEGFDPFSPYKGTILESLAKFGSLKELHLEFTIAAGRTYTTNHVFLLDPWHRIRRMSSPAEFSASCQDVFVDCFFTLAYEQLLEVPRVTFSGNVTQANQDKWGPLLKTTKKELLPGYAQSVAGILTTPDHEL